MSRMTSGFRPFNWRWLMLACRCSPGSPWFRSASTPYSSRPGSPGDGHVRLPSPVQARIPRTGGTAQRGHANGGRTAMRSRMMGRRIAGIVGVVLAASTASPKQGFAADSSSGSQPPASQPISNSPSDPGVRGRAPGAGGPLPGLSIAEQNFFAASRNRFRAVYSVSGTLNDAPAGIINGAGLGPRYNANSCAACHPQPAIGGTSPPSTRRSSSRPWMAHRTLSLRSSHYRAGA